MIKRVDFDYFPQGQCGNIIEMCALYNAEDMSLDAAWNKIQQYPDVANCENIVFMTKKQYKTVFRDLMNL